PRSPTATATAAVVGPATTTPACAGTTTRIIAALAPTRAATVVVVAPPTPSAWCRSGCPRARSPAPAARSTSATPRAATAAKAAPETSASTTDPPRRSADAVGVRAHPASANRRFGPLPTPGSGDLKMPSTPLSTASHLFSALAFGTIAASSLLGHGKAGLTDGGDNGGLGIPGLDGDNAPQSCTITTADP